MEGDEVEGVSTSSDIPMIAPWMIDAMKYGFKRWQQV